MRILMLSDVYFPRVNGVSTSIMTFREELERMGHEVVLVAPRYGVEGEEENAGLVRVPSSRVILDPEDRMMHWGALNQRLEQLWDEQPFDLLHIHTPFVAHYAGVSWAKRHGIPCVETYHTFFEAYLHHYIPFMPRFVMRALARRFSREQCNNVDGLVIPSTLMQAELGRYGVTVTSEVIPTGIELEEFSDGDGARFRAKHGINADRPVLLYLGRVAFEKNISFLLDMLVQVLQEKPETLLVIAGEGPAEKSLHAKVRHLGLQGSVLFVGYLKRGPALLDCYKAADVFVFASRTETQGLVLLEAMALGVPVVALSIMGTRDILQPGSGALVPEDDVHDFAGKVVQLLRDDELRRWLGAEGVQYIQHWKADRLAIRLDQFYAQICQAHAARAVLAGQTV